MSLYIIGASSPSGAAGSRPRRRTGPRRSGNNDNHNTTTAAAATTTTTATTVSTATTTTTTITTTITNEHNNNDDNDNNNDASKTNNDNATNTTTGVGGEADAPGVPAARPPQRDPRLHLPRRGGRGGGTADHLREMSPGRSVHQYWFIGTAVSRLSLFVLAPACWHLLPVCRQSGDEEPARSSPHWKKLRFDPSVTVDEPAHFPHNLAGFILASASLSNWEGPSGPAGVANRAATSSVSAPDPQTSEGRRPSSKDASVLSTLLPTNIRAPLCTPLQKCTPTHFLAVGSPGATGDICSVPVGKLRRVYCHVDVLAARNLPAMDEDGLAECCYRVQMMGTTLSMPGGSTKSLSPSFMHRVTIPFDAVVSEHPTLPDCLTNPLPPVVFKMCPSSNDTNTIMLIVMMIHSNDNIATSNDTKVRSRRPEDLWVDGGNPLRGRRGRGLQARAHGHYCYYHYHYHYHCYC